MVASHERIAERGQVRYEWEHYIPLVQRIPGALRNGAPFADHSCYAKTRRPALGQIWIGPEGQYWIGANSK